MKARKIETVRKCPFCGGAINVTHGIIGAPYYFFKCKSCGAIMSFDNDECNADPKRAIDYFNKRVRE